MSSSSRRPLLDVVLRPGRPPISEVDPGGDPGQWVAAHRDALRRAVTEHGAILVRGLGLQDAAEVSAVFHRLADGLMVEREAFGSRRTVTGGVYTSTDWPGQRPMPMHHELSYALEFPGLMLFACLTPPAAGGATALADSAAVLRELPTPLVNRFEREGWLLVRNYHDETGVAVAEAFGTGDRVAVERYCRANAIEFAWQPDGGLQTWQRRSALVRHPVTGDRCWFNQVASLNEWALDVEVRELLADGHGANSLPSTTRFGDGQPIAPDQVELINAVYEACTVRETWQQGDLMLVDNVRTAHGREPFIGPREVLVALADPLRITNCAPSIEVTAG